MTDYTLRCAFFDDKVTSEYEDMLGGLREGLARIDSRLKCELEKHGRFHAGTERLRDRSNPLDLALIDVFWTRDERGTVDAAEDLLAPALARSDSVVILTSGGDGALTGYLYHPAKAQVRPHAVFHKDANKLHELMEGILRAAFSKAGQRLNSLVVDVTWDEDEHQIGLSTTDKICLEELACWTFNQAKKVTIRPIGGGLSGAVTLLMEGTGVDRNGHPAPQGYLLKAHRDPQLLEVELAAHQENARKLPAGLFARPIHQSPKAFGGWSAIAFDEAPGTTVSASRAEPYLWDAWQRIFSKAAINRLAKIARGNDIEPSGSLLTSSEGALRGERHRKFVEGSADLGPSSSDAATLARPAIDWFTAEPTPVTVGHADLHTRNVLVDTDGTVVWVDAASMVARSHWASDLARFSVWLAFELAQDKNLDAETVIAGLALNDPSTTDGDALDDLRGSIEGTLADCAMSFAQQGRATGPSQWRDAVIAETMRVVYSRDSFDRDRRALACEVLLMVADAETRRA